MALRSALPKIKSSIFQNYCRLFSYKFDMTAARPAAEETEAAAPSAQSAPVEEEPEAVEQNFRYSVCQERTTSKDKPVSISQFIDNQRQSVRDVIQEQKLQPCSMPEYYHTRMDTSVRMPDEADKMEENVNRSSYSRFQVSKTCANCTLPLKQVKLANPFPEPVKTMMSHTVSDEEKAQQMLAESKSQLQFADWRRSTSGQRPQSVPPQRSFSTVAHRYYSSEVGTDPGKCKKLKAPKNKKTCPRMHLPGCDPPAKNISCVRKPSEVHCKKQEAPYPAYSEFCHEDIEEKPSECRLCFWKPEDNPNFKPPKKKFHTGTSDVLNMRRTGLEVDSFFYDSSGRGRPETEHAQTEEAVQEGSEEAEGMLCDLSKPPCNRPPRRPCADVGKKKKDQGKASGGDKKKDKPKKAQSFTSIAKLMANRGSMQTRYEVQDVLDEPEVAEEVVSMASKSEKKKKEQEEKGPCKKFKFPTCKKEKKKEEVKVGKCPPKKKKRQVKDCPPEDDEQKCRAVEDVLEIRMSSKDDDDGGKKRKCPVVDMTTEVEEKPPCKVKRSTSKICPGDLLKKKDRVHPRKKKDKKEAIGVVPPHLMKTKETHPPPPS